MTLRGCTGFVVCSGFVQDAKAAIFLRFIDAEAAPFLRFIDGITPSFRKISNSVRIDLVARFVKRPSCPFLLCQVEPPVPAVDFARRNPSSSFVSSRSRF
jgi:hypothetical protein